VETKQKFLSFNLGVKDIAVFSLQYVAEVLQVSLAEVSVVPQMPRSVLGIYNWRGEMLWLVDLEEMLGYPPMLQGANFISKMMAVVLESDGKFLGLLVRQLTDIEWLDPQEMKSPSAELFYPETSPLLQGYFINDSQQMILSLDALAIMQSPLWGIHN
jgi:positive phototaxis protein PixI